MFNILTAVRTAAMGQMLRSTDLILVTGILCCYC